MVRTQTMKNCEGTTGIRNRFLRGQAWSFQVIEAPRGRPFGGGAGHRNSGIATSRNYWNFAIFMGNPRNIFLNALFWLRHLMPPPPTLWHPLRSDNSRESDTTQSQSAGRFGTGNFPSG